MISGFDLGHKLIQKRSLFSEDKKFYSFIKFIQTMYVCKVFTNSICKLPKVKLSFIKI